MIRAFSFSPCWPRRNNDRLTESAQLDLKCLIVSTIQLGRQPTIVDCASSIFDWRDSLTSADELFHSIAPLFSWACPSSFRLMGWLVARLVVRRALFTLYTSGEGWM